MKTEHSLWNPDYLRVWTANFLLTFAFMLLTPLLPLYLSETFGAFALFCGGYLLVGSLLTFTVLRTLHGFVRGHYERNKLYP